MHINDSIITWPTCFTLLRIILIPFILYAILIFHWGLACCLCIVAGLTDLFDGMLARFLHQETLLGACLDPVADKALLVSVFVVLSKIKTPFFIVPSWFALIVFLKESVIIAGFLLLFFSKGSAPQIRPTLLSKLTTSMQLFFVVCLLSCYYFQWISFEICSIAISVMTLLIIATCMQYFSIGYSIIMNGLYEHKI